MGRIGRKAALWAFLPLVCLARMGGAKDVSLVLSDAPVAQAGETNRITIRFGDLPLSRAPATLIYRYPSSCRDVDVPFEFQHVPLP